MTLTIGCIKFLWAGAKKLNSHFSMCAVHSLEARWAPMAPCENLFSGMLRFSFVHTHSLFLSLSLSLLVCNFPMNHHIRLFVGGQVCHNFLKGGSKMHFPSYYRSRDKPLSLISTFFCFFFIFWITSSSIILKRLSHAANVAMSNMSASTY